MLLRENKCRNNPEHLENAHSPIGEGQCKLGSNKEVETITNYEVQATKPTTSISSHARSLEADGKGSSLVSIYYNTFTRLQP